LYIYDFTKQCAEKIKNPVSPTLFLLSKKEVTLLGFLVSRNAATLATNRLLTSIAAKRSELCAVA
jgi:hypothetical protein